MVSQAVLKSFPLYVRLARWKHKRVGPDKLIDFLKTKQSPGVHRAKIHVHAACVDILIGVNLIAEGIPHEKALDAFHALIAGNDEHAYGKLRDKFKFPEAGETATFIQYRVSVFFEDFVKGEFVCLDYRSPGKRGRG